MQLKLTGFEHEQAIPPQYAFCIMDPETRVKPGPNLNPGISWEGAPEGTKSFVLICVDTDAPSKPDDVNKAGRFIPVGLPRANFYHWVMVDIPPNITSIAEGSCSNGLTPKGKQNPPGPPGSRQGLNDYTGWFQGSAEMEGRYFGYDGPCPPWNDSIVHHYHFVLYATGLAHCPVEGGFTGPQVEQALEGNVLAMEEVVGTYSLNPRVPV